MHSTWMVRRDRVGTVRGRAANRACKPWLDQLAADNSFAVDYFEDPKLVNDEFLSKYKVIFQMNYPPYMWSDTAKAAFEKYIIEGKGGWVGVHHATLLGEFDGYPMWNWF